jgi:hypothetical protein
MTPGEDGPPTREFAGIVRTCVLAVGVGVGYGLAMRLVYGAVSESWAHLLSVGFLFVVPALMGVLVALLVPVPRFDAACVPAALSVIGFMVGVVATSLEGLICVVMMSPPAFVSAIVAALLTTAVRRGGGRAGRGPMAVLPLLPLVVSAGERAAGAHEEVRVVETSTTIRAPRETVWANVVRVPEIRDEERVPTFFHSIGFPRPIDATIDREGLGSVRHATFERGAVFVETVFVWRPFEELAFSIDPSRVPPTAFDEHVSPGGPYFTTLEGRYRLERALDGAIVLRLTSRSRLATTLNWYAGPWMEAAVRSIQEDILRIVKARCERGETPR